MLLRKNLDLLNEAQMGLGFFVFLVKLFALSLPFLFIGAIASPFVPNLGVGLTLIIGVITLIFGFVLMVVRADDIEDSKRGQRLTLLAKIVFFCFLVFTIGCFMHSAGPQLGPYRIISIPLCMVAAKVFFRIRLMDYLE